MQFNLNRANGLSNWFTPEVESYYDDSKDMCQQPFQECTKIVPMKKCTNETFGLTAFLQLDYSIFYMLS